MTALVDLHCHGSVGETFGADVGGSRRAADHHRRHGTEHLVASLVSAPPDLLVRQCATLAGLVAERALAGIHLEGPFLAAARRGAHHASALRAPDVGLVSRCVDAVSAVGAPGAIRHLTLAPELPGALDLLPRLAAYGIRPAFGHTAATGAKMRAALLAAGEASGAPPLVTHLFNGMPPMHHRDGGPAAAALTAAARGEAVVEIVADGVHVDSEMVLMVFETVGAEQIALVSDATAGTGLGDGDHRLGEVPVRVTSGVARVITADGTPGPIAGSTATLADCLRWAVDIAGVDPADACTAASVTPATVI